MCFFIYLFFSFIFFFYNSLLLVFKTPYVGLTHEKHKPQKLVSYKKLLLKFYKGAPQDRYQTTVFPNVTTFSLSVLFYFLLQTAGGTLSIPIMESFREEKSVYMCFHQCKHALWQSLQLSVNHSIIFFKLIESHYAETPRLTLVLWT